MNRQESLNWIKSQLSPGYASDMWLKERDEVLSSFENHLSEGDDLYSALTCALLHNIDACGKCMKCKGEDEFAIRMNLVRRLANYMNKELPWEESTEEK